MTPTRIPIGQLVADPEQPRKPISDESFGRLVGSIRERGLLQPIRVRPADSAGNHVIVFGHRRAAALAKLGETLAVCVVDEGMADAATVLADQLTENLVRENLSPIEEAEGYRRYIALRGITAAKAAEELSVTPSRISRGLALLDLPDELRQHLHTGWVHSDTGYHLSRLPSGSERDRLITRAVAGDLTRDEAARAAKPLRSASPAEPASGRVTCKLGGGRALTVSGEAVTLESLIATLEQVLKVARKGRAQGWHVGTLAKVFRDRAAKGGAA